MADKEKTTEIDFLKAEVKRLRNVLNELTPSLTILLKRRGMRIYKKEPSEDLLIPETLFVGSFYEMLKKYSFRLFLRDVIKHQPLFTLSQVTRYSTKEVTEHYIKYLAKVGIVIPEDNAYRLKKGRIKSFGETLEWFVAEILKQEFAADALWGVKIKRRNVGGDYDLLAKVDGSILYMEVKSSPPKQIYLSEIIAFLKRVYDLGPEVAIFLDDTELRMKDKIVPMFEEGLKTLFPEPPEVVRLERELFAVREAEPAVPRIFIINAKDSIIGNIERVLAEYFRRMK